MIKGTASSKQQFLQMLLLFSKSMVEDSDSYAISVSLLALICILKRPTG